MDKPQIKKLITTSVIMLIIIGIIYITFTFIYNKHTVFVLPKDKFSDLILNDVAVGDQVDSDTLTYYNCYFNPNTKQNLKSGSDKAVSNYVNNSAVITNQFQTLSTAIDTLMIQLNNDILNNIGANYGRAHLLNKQREEMKKSLNDLPLKNI